MSGMDLKEMRNKAFLTIILITPPLVLLCAWFLFLDTFDEESRYSGKTKNNGVFFESFFNLNEFKTNQEDQTLIEFEDGKWILAVYLTDIEKSSDSIYLMRQLNVALNRDINKVKRVIFYSNKMLEDNLINLKKEYPRAQIIEDKNDKLFNLIQDNSKLDFNMENPIFVVDPYGRAVMYFKSGTDPKLILKDLKVLI